MRMIIVVLAAGFALSGCATSKGYWYGDQQFNTREECLAAKNQGSGQSAGGTQGKGATVGAAAAGATALIAGGNLAQTAAAAGGGAAAGALFGRRAC